MFLSGCLSGILLNFSAKILINKRVQNVLEMNSETRETETGVLSGMIRFSGMKKIDLFLLMALNGIGWLIAAEASGTIPEMISLVLAFSICLLLSCIDIKIKRIPNELVLFLFLLSIFYTIVNVSRQNVGMHFLGFLTGLLLFIIPFLMKSGAGSGDVKLAAATGFFLGYPDILRAILIMGGVLFLWLIGLILSRKGGLKTKIAMGPFISIGFVTALLISSSG